VSRFVNHSCAPNLRIACVRDGGVLPRLCLFTSKEVKKGEELTFAYGEGSSEGGRVCRCGAGDCQGVLPFHPGL
jgi:histone-lysine N-methyltransferase SETMAR